MRSYESADLSVAIKLGDTLDIFVSVVAAALEVAKILHAASVESFLMRPEGVSIF